MRLLVIDRPCHRDQFLVGAMALPGSNHDFLGDDGAPNGIAVPADPPRAAYAITARLLPRYVAAAHTLGVSTTWRAASPALAAPPPGRPAAGPGAMPCRPTPTATADLVGNGAIANHTNAPGVPAIDPVRITVGQHHVLGLLALTTEEVPGVEHDLLTHAGFTLQPGDFLYTLPGTPNDPAAIRAAVTTLRTSARALGVRIGVDPGLTITLEQAPAPASGRSADHGRAAQDGPALTTAVPAQPAPSAAPRPHPLR